MAILSDEFYYQPIRIDTINTRVFADLIAKEGDVNGRGILLTLTENGLMKDTTGIALNLKWEHMSVGNQGVDNFEAVDLTKGLYKITYPIEMLNLGTVRGYIQIIDSGKSAGIRNLKITIERGVGDDTVIVRSDSFTALAQALIDVNKLEETYAPELNSVKQQLVETNAQVDLINRGLGETFATLTDLQTAYPTGDTKDHIVGADGHRYFWNETAWADGGAYQAIELVDGIVTESKTSFFKPGKNLFDGISYSGYINTSGVFGVSGTYVYLKRIKTKGLSAVIWSGQSSDGVTRTGRTARFVTAYDANNNVLTAHSVENVKQYIVPDPIVAYVILTFSTSSFSASSFQVESGTTITNYEYYYNKIAPEYLLFSKTEFLKRMLQGKKVAIFGDSIMWGAGSSGVALGELLAQKYGMIVYKYAISGAVMGQSPTKSHIADQVSAAIATGIVFDFIFFNGGTNDSYETDNVPKCPLGVITTDYTSVLDETTFSGGFEKVAKLLCDSFPYALKAYVRPHNMASRPYDNQITYGENGLKICDKWGFGYIDMYKTMNTWLSYYQTKYLSDSTHPNLIGYTDKYLPEAEKFLFNVLI